VDVDHLKNLTKVTQRARNESKAPPTHTKWMPHTHIAHTRLVLSLSPP
jgi:hypothetical protein